METAYGDAGLLASGGDSGRWSSQVQVQLCGRQETLRLTRVCVAELAPAIERAFEVGPPYLFTDRGGRRLQDDAALAACVAGEGLIVVKLSEGVMHDLSRRVDQLRHLQWGLVTDRAASAQQDVWQYRADVKKLRLSLEHEQSLRENLNRDFQHTTDGLQEQLWKERSSRDEALHGVAERIQELRLSVQRSLDEHTEEDAAQRRGIADLARALETERVQRDQADTAIISGYDELRLSLQSQASMRDEATQRLRRDFDEQRAEDLSESRKEILDIRRQIGEIRQLTSKEQMERADAIQEVKSAIGELQRLVTQEVSERQRDSKNMLSALQELESSSAAGQRDFKELHVEASKRHQDIVERHQEEKGLRQADVAELGRQLESLRRSYEKDESEREHLSSSLSRLTEEISKRWDEENAKREADLAKVTRLAYQETGQRAESEREMSDRIFALEQKGGGMTEVRAREVREIQRQVAETAAALQREQEAWASKHAAHVEELAKHRKLVLDEQHHRGLELTDVGNAIGVLENHRNAIQTDLERAMRSIGESESNHGSYRDSIEDLTNKLNEADRKYTAIAGEHRELLNDVVAEFRQELKDLTKVLSKVREEVKEALLREVRSRMEGDSSLQKSIELEAHARLEAVGALDRHIEQLRGAVLGSPKAALSQHPPQRGVAQATIRRPSVT
eukprot:TRINITY_DN74307_c0_g1_i1.p1 TRINITY_DN74307_c0_g1~~TRINITY_DN74307_c0_g1_i1.p1  ORF type:complete len:681 (-),score=156.30 TRINITY_DN74307_c0_g1_i1:5-2047(-)